MKTKEEWNWEYTKICANDPAVHGQLLPNPQNMAFIKLVQLDAFKAGEEHATKIDQHFHFPMQDKPINAPSAKAILADAKERKELPE
jgi:hypothetical protein